MVALVCAPWVDMTSADQRWLHLARPHSRRTLCLVIGCSFAGPSYWPMAHVRLDFSFLAHACFDGLVVTQLPTMPRGHGKESVPLGLATAAHHQSRCNVHATRTWCSVCTLPSPSHMGAIQTSCRNPCASIFETLTQEPRHGAHLDISHCVCTMSNGWVVQAQ